MTPTDRPLVSVCIVTYNSSATIAEALDSVYAQSYPLLELVVSDDCSTDDTLAVCRKWIDGHRPRFVRSVIVEGQSNSGVAHNLNKAIQASSGEWLKTLAGDDLLTRDCIKDNIDFVGSNETDGIVFSKAHFFRAGTGGIVLEDRIRPSDAKERFFDLDAREQYISLLASNYITGPTLFIRRDLALGHPFPEEYPFCEDWPQWTRLTKAGVRLRYFGKETSLYRISDSLSISMSSGQFLNPKFHHSMMAFFYAERSRELLSVAPDVARRQQKEFFLGDITLILLKNRRNLFTRALIFIFKRILGVEKKQ